MRTTKSERAAQINITSTQSISIKKKGRKKKESNHQFVCILSQP